MNTRKIIAWIPAHFCYWLGDLWSKPLNWEWTNNEEESEWTTFWVGFWYVPYNKLMYCSLVLSDWADLGLWETLSDEEIEERYGD